MTDIEKSRIQRDARRIAAGRRTSSSTDPSQAIIRHLGVELYKETRRADRTPSDHENPKDDEPAK
ncbi:MAG: hypothetical protein HOV67_24335 [Kribbellaceae bacterium]|nr:hypothetical protein [Kribbellaceae bacterium]